MDPQKLRMLTLAAAGAAALTVATDAAACEACMPDPEGGEICWSGMDYGGGSCWGGSGEQCVEEGSCTGDQQECYWWEYCDEEGDYWCWGWGDCES